MMIRVKIRDNLLKAPIRAHAVLPTKDMQEMSHRMPQALDARLGSEAFFDCGNLWRVTVPHNATSIGDSGFRYCCKLRGLRVPLGVKSLGVNVCMNCSDLEFVVFAPESELETIGWCVFMACAKLKQLNFPLKGREIGDHACCNCVTLEFLQLSPSLVEIPDCLSSVRNCADSRFRLRFARWAGKRAGIVHLLSSSSSRRSRSSTRFTGSASPTVKN
jgi:hypothetical protein